MLKHNGCCASFDYIVETLSHLTIQGRCEIESANDFNWLSATDTWRNISSALRVYIWHYQWERFFHLTLQPGQYLIQCHHCGVCRRVKLTLLRDTSEDVRISKVGQLFWSQIEEASGQWVCGLVVIYDQNVLKGSILVIYQNELWYYCRPCHCPTCVECLELDCKVEYSNANQGIIPESHNSWSNIQKVISTTASKSV